MKLKKQNNTLTIDNNHKYFKDTPYKKEIFSLTIQEDTSTGLSVLTDAIKDQAIRTGDTSGEVPTPLAIKWRILSPIVSWSGFYDANDNEAPCNLENKSSFYEMSEYQEFFSIVRRIKEEHFAEVKKDAEIVEDATKKQ